MPLCHDCHAEPATSLWDEGYEHAFWTGVRMIHVCADCWTKRDNYEPPEPDGEAFRGHEARDYRAWQDEQARRLK